MSRILPPHIPAGKLPAIYRKSLDQLSDVLIERIHGFIARPLERDVTEAVFQVFPDEYGDQTSSVWMYFTGENNRVNDADDRLFAGRSIEFFADFTSLPMLDPAVHEKLDFAHTLTSLIQDWFAECWWKAGGWYYPVPVAISGHEGFGNREATQLTPRRERA